MLNENIYYIYIFDFKSEGSLSPERLRNRRMHSGRFMGLMNCSTISDTGQSCNGADRLAAAAFRVDRMLEELNAVAELSSKNDCCPFPTALSMSTRSLRSCFALRRTNFYISLIFFPRTLHLTWHFK